MSALHVRVDRSLTGLVVLLGAWTMYAQVGALMRLPFATLRLFSWVPFLVCMPLVLHASRAVEPTCAEPIVADVRRRSGWRLLPRGLWIGAPFVLAVLYAVMGSDRLFWFLATVYLTAALWHLQVREHVEAPTDQREPRFAVVALLALCAIAALLTAGARRPDADDAYHLNVAVSEARFPELPPQGFDSLHRDGLPPVEQTLHLPQTYEVMVGLLSGLSAISVPVLYYLVLPPLWAVLGTTAHWLALRHVLPSRGAIAGTALFVCLLVFWGDGYRTFGNFGFVRLFQGKAVYLVVLLPLLTLAALRYRHRPSLIVWLTLALCQCAAVGLTTNPVVVAPLAAALVIMAPPCDSRALPARLVGVAASVPVLGIALAMYPRLAPYRLAMSADPVLMGLPITLGSTRTPLVLLALAVLPALAARAHLRLARWVAGYVWIVVLVVFMPLVARVGSAALGPVYSWRLFWAVPVPLLVSLAGGTAATAWPTRRWWPVLGLVAWSVAFAVAGPLAVPRDVFSLDHLGRLKVVDAPYRVAEAVVAVARPDALALVPEDVAVYVAGLSGAPPLVGVRELYLTKLRGLVPAAELDSRLALFRYAYGGSPDMSIARALDQIEERHIGTVAFPDAHRDAAALVSELATRGFAVHHAQDFVIAVRHNGVTAPQGRRP